MIIDAGIHLWRPERPDRPWPDDRKDHPPQRENGFEPAEMLALMDGHGVDRAVVVPPIWIGDDNSDAVEWAAQYPDRFAVMGRFPLTGERGDLVRALDGWLDQPGMLGIRMSYPAGQTWLDVDALDWFWSAAQKARIPVMLLCQAQSARVAPIAARYPELTLIVDHLALRNVRALRAAGKPADPSDTLDDLLRLAEFPHVYAKFSSLPYYSAEPYPYRDLDPALRRARDAFGAERLMWASDITRMSLLSEPPTYAQTLDHVRELEFLDDQERASVLGGTAATVLGWPG